MPTEIIDAGAFQLHISKGFVWVELRVYEKQAGDLFDLVGSWEKIPVGVFSRDYARDFFAQYDPLSKLL